MEDLQTTISDTPLDQKLDDKPSILIVDDIMTNRMLLKKLLKDADSELLEADNGRKALSLVAKTPNIALILLDVQMPEMDGYEVAEFLQSDSASRHIPIIFVTAVSRDEADVLKGYHSGAIDYITKPVKPAILKAKVKQFIELWFLRSGLMQEIQRRIELEEKNIFLANHDVLTGLANRRSIFLEIERTIIDVNRSGDSFAVLFIDLDGFKTINDTYGHGMGDFVLKELANRFTELLRKTDVIARFGGDEFVAIIKNCDDTNDLLNVVEKLLEVANKTVMLNNNEEVRLSASIGVCVYPKCNEKAEALLDFADMAMYKAKVQGKNQFHFFSEQMNEEAHRRVQIEKALKIAIDEQEIAVNYQPLVRVDNGEAIGVESLVRWTDRNLGFISPEDFIPIAEASGLIYQLSEIVFAKSLEQIGFLDKKLNINTQIAINASTLQFQTEAWYNTVKKAIDDKIVRPGDLEIEITERLLLDDSSTVNSQLQAFRDLGVHLSVDDFGTGYSSLSYLKRCPVNTVKIDRSFIMEIPNDKDDMVLVRTIIAMAHGLGLKVIAEGVETQEQWDYLRAENCDYAQGYFFSRPLDIKALESWMIENKSGFVDK